MTKHPKIEVNEKLLKLNLPKLEKQELTTFIAETLTKDEMIQALLSAWKQANFTTNEKIEKHYNKIFKEENV